MASPGTVYLVGAGPGDPGLVTRRALELVQEADAIVYDRLIPPGLIAEARPDADLRYAGKEPGQPSMEQEAINDLLVELAQAGKSVVRLKGGDPFVFGRGGEEAQALRAASIPFEVVPGVTAGIAAPAYAGIPVTHRDTASAVAFITGHEDPEKPESVIDWAALAAFPGTLVFYMGVKQLPEIARKLIEAGRPADQPAAVVERGTLASQRSILATLDSIAERVQAEGVKPPAITLVGPVAALAGEIAWLEQRPLYGRTIAVTRARAQASDLARQLARLGAEVIETPAIRIQPREVSGEVAQAAREIGTFALVCVTSPNGAALLMDAVEAVGGDARSFAGVEVAAIGPGTAAELARRGIRPDVVAEVSTAEGLLDALSDIDVGDERVLVARAAEARDALPEGLRARGADVVVTALYDTVAEALDEAQLAALERADYVTFTSSSTVRFFMEALGAHGLPNGARVVSIGPITSATAREHGLEVHAEATRHDIDGLVEALLAEAARP
ncbi:MAG: uroporphyrinogen methyltransferase / synthase [Thermoleophilaceae bacterium]|nr:uroporphyrinogen methyltransferase / synthase [Thermoleophilaceae bacterium]